MAALYPSLVITEVTAGGTLGYVVTVPPGTGSAGPGGTGSGALLPPAPPKPESPTVTVITGVKKCSFTFHLGQPEDVSYEVGGPQTSHLTPGLQPGKARVIGISLDQGATQDTRMLSMGTEVVYDLPCKISESGKGLAVVAGAARINRFCAQQISVNDAFNGKPNTIVSTAGDILAPKNILPDQAGIAFAPIGIPGSPLQALCSFTYICSPAVSAITLDIDANRDTAARATAAITDRLGAAIDPQLAQVTFDSGDNGVFGGTQTVNIGFKGDAPLGAFDGVSGLPTTPWPILRGTTAQAQTQDMCASCSFTGGSTHHGMPDGGKITAIVTINNQAGDATGDYRSGLLVLGIYVDRDSGGVAFWPGDGTMYFMSQAMGVTSLWYDEVTHTLYAATDLGVYHHSADPGDTSKWGRLGTMAQKVLKLVKDNGTLYALVEFVNGQRHILQYPAAMGQLDSFGYGGWSSVLSPGGTRDFAVCSGVLYYICDATPAWVMRHVIGSTLPDTPMKTSPDGSIVPTGLDVLTDGNQGSVVTGIMVRTSAGSEAIFAIQGPDTNLISANPQGKRKGGLVDQFGAYVQVNSISQHGAGVVQYTTGSRTVQLWACTNRGLFASDQPFGGNWRRTTGQNNLADTSVQWAASAPPRTWLGTMRTAVYTAGPSRLDVSWDGTLHFVDVLAKTLDVGPAFFALWKARYAVLPNNTATKLNYPNPQTGPYVLMRGLDGLGHYEYILYNPTSQAPGGAHRYASITQIATPALLSEARSAQVLLDEMTRLLSYCAAPQTILEIDSMFSDTGDLLRLLRPGHMVTVTGTFAEYINATLITYVTYTNLVAFVLQHTITYDAELDPLTCTTKTRLGTLLLESRSDEQRLVGDMSYQINRQALYAMGRVS